MNLSQGNLASIQQVIFESPISRLEMREDIVDHLCCEVEKRMLSGCDFETAFNQALFLLAPNGLKELELETFYLLNSKTIAMKKLAYFSGAFFSILSSMGILLKVLHWFGANELLIVGFGGLLFVFLPLFWMARSKQTAEESSFERRRHIAGLISLMLISGGAVLKVLHLVSANELLLVGTLAFSFGFVPMTFIKMYRQSITA